MTSSRGPRDGTRSVYGPGAANAYHRRALGRLATWRKFGSGVLRTLVLARFALSRVQDSLQTPAGRRAPLVVTRIRPGVVPARRRDDHRRTVRGVLASVLIWAATEFGLPLARLATARFLLTNSTVWPLSSYGRS